MEKELIQDNNTVMNWIGIAIAMLAGAVALLTLVQAWGTAVFIVTMIKEYRKAMKDES